MARPFLLVVACAALIALCSIFVYVTLEARRDVGRNVETSAANLTAAVAHDVDRNIELLDLSLRAVVECWEDPAVRSLSPALRRKIMLIAPPTRMVAEACWCWTPTGSFAPTPR